MLKAISQFFYDCFIIGSFFAHHLTPRFLHPLAIPLLAVTAGPAAKIYTMLQDYCYERSINHKLRRHDKIGNTEEKLRAIFGSTVINGYTGDDNTIAMQFNEAALYIVTPADDTYRIHTEAFSQSREEAAKALIGIIARELAATPSDILQKHCKPYKKYFVVCKEGDVKKQFYSAQEIGADGTGTDENSVFQISYKEDFEDEAERKFYDVRAVDCETQKQLALLFG